MEEMKCVNDVAIKLADFNVSSTRGFVPYEDPLTRLPEYFSAWEEVCDIIPRLWKEGTTRSVIEQLPLLDHNKLSTEREWYRAHMVMAILSHSYVWCRGEQGAAKILPKCLAVPWDAASKHLGIPPVIVYSTYLLNNWKIVDPSRPLSMDNIEILNTFTGSKSEEGFLKASFQVEISFGKGASIILEAQKAVADQNANGVKEALINVRQTISSLETSLQRMHEVCDPKHFYCVLRPFLNGWNLQSALTGLIFEGVSPVPVECSGSSAAESSIFPALDVFLGIQHIASPGKVSFTEQMKLYMPPKHREFIKVVADGPRIRDFVLERNDQSLVEKYNECIVALKDFRTTHLSIVAKYVIVQANRYPNNPNECLANEGTGGSGLMPFLKKIREETKVMLITSEK